MGLCGAQTQGATMMARSRFAVLGALFSIEVIPAKSIRSSVFPV